MSHYNVNYNELTGDAKRLKAIQDIKDYLGEDRFNNIEPLLRQAKKDGMSLEQMAMNLSLAGIQGYPVQAWYESI